MALIGEGETEFHCLPKIAGLLGNVVIGRARTITVSSDYDWERFFQVRVVPLVQAMALKNPDKILIVLDREDRPECPATLARQGLEVTLKECRHCLTGHCSIGVVISNRKFECILFADYSTVDRLPILTSAVSHDFPEKTDENDVLDWIQHAVRDGCTYDKVEHGGFLAKHMRHTEDTVQARSRSLRKLVRELSETREGPPPNHLPLFPN